MTALQQYYLTLTPPAPNPSPEEVYGLLLHYSGSVLANYPGARKPLSLAQVESSEGRTRFVVGVLTRELTAALSDLMCLRGQVVPFGSGSAVLHALEPVHPQPLTYQALFDQEETPRHFGLQFLTPTHIHPDRMLPDPATLFSAMLARFNMYSPIQFPAEVLTDLGRLRITRYRLRTRAVTFPTHRITGFVGEVVYNVPGGCPPETANLALALLRFACFSGVGARTHLGLGHVALTQKEVRT